MPRTTISDFGRALTRVDELLAKYEPKHKNAWRTQTLISHSSHGATHAEQAAHDMHYGMADSAAEENLASNACRALMLLERFLQLRAEREKLPRPL